MNRYQNMVNTLPVPEGQAARLKAAVLAAEPMERGRRPFRPRRRGRKLALAAAVAAALLITAAASEAADWDPVFLGIFGPASREVPGAEGLFQDVQAVSTCGDVTLRVRQAMGDKENLYLLLDYQLPEDTEPEALSAEDLRPPKILVYKGRGITWEDVEPLSDIEEAERELGSDSVSGQVTGIEDFDPENRTLSVLVECDLADWSPLARIPNASVTLVAGPPLLCAEDEDGEDIPLADQLAVVSFTPDFHVASAKGSARAEDGTSYKAEVSPLSLSVRVKGKDLPDWAVGGQLLPEFKALLSLRFRDGTVTPAADLEQPGGSSHGSSSLTRHDDGSLSGSLTLNLVFETFLDPAQVEAVLVGDVEVPVS